MARFPKATWRGPVPNLTPGGMSAHRGLVLHIQEGTESGTDAWFHNPASQVSAHFGNPKSGPLDQWVDTDDRAWAEVDGNPEWISVENEGNSGDVLTASQLENAAQLFAWIHTTYGVPLQPSDSTVPGLTGHGLGGQAWGGHLDCPGQPILDQRPQIIARAAQIAGGAPTPKPPTPNPPTPAPPTHPSSPLFGGNPVATIPSSIGQFWPEIAGQFPANQNFDNETALIWADGGARAAALYAKQARDAVTALAGRVGAPPAVDINALAAALAPHLAGGANAQQIAQAVAQHLGADLAKG
ncbi:hypothetical protein ABH920_006380 [Catenulispora sp. EB89]|uniref:peptidoglycan recognition protein family protein n=1 Tax=Catenulispora sp. EB89 TaxID=3156257 RepID=UPI00351584D1